MGSTQSVNATDNVVLAPNVPIYLMDGFTKLVDSSTQLFGCCEAGSSITLPNPLNKDQFGNSVGDVKVWTGTGQDGLTNDAMTGTIPGAELGTTLIAFGKSGVTGAGWMYNSTAFVTDNGAVGIPFEKPFYAFSEQLGNVSTTFEWKTDTLGLWDEATNWTPNGGPPVNSNQTAVFAGMTTVPTTVVTNNDLTLNRIEFNNASNGYAISGLGSVELVESPTFDAPRIDVTSGVHEFQLDVNLTTNTTVDVGFDSSLTFESKLTLGGSVLTKTGAGNFAVNNILSSGGGSIDCQAGTCSGSGTIGGDLNNSGGTVSPGNSPGVMEVQGDYNQSAAASLSIEIAGTAAGAQHDVLVVGGEATLDGTLEVSLIDGFQPASGDSFDILELGSITGDFNDIVLPNLTGSLAWDVSALLTDGSIGVVPEPAAAVLLLGGLWAVVGIRRRW